MREHCRRIVARPSCDPTLREERLGYRSSGCWKQILTEHAKYGERGITIAASLMRQIRSRRKSNFLPETSRPRNNSTVILPEAMPMEGARSLAQLPIVRL